MRKKLQRSLIYIFILLLVGAAIIFEIIHIRHSSRPGDSITLYGNIDVRQVDLGFRVAGRVTQMFFEEGDLVAPGQLMGVLDNQPYADQVTEALSRVRSSKATMEKAEKILVRRQDLIKDGSVAQEDLDTAIADKQIAEADILNAVAGVAVARSNLSYTEVYAPTEGTILTRIREVGTVVNAGDAIYTLSITSPVWVRAFISEADLGVVYPGMPAVIYTDTPGGKTYEGKVGFISPVAEFTPKTVETTQLRTDLVYRLRIYADNPDKGLRQGMPVTVKLTLGASSLKQEES
jgi:HlyD family secretion protein